MNFRFKNWASSKTFWWNLFIFLLFCWFVLFRFLVIGSQTSVHYHADFMIYINSEAQTLDSSSFYEEVTACSESAQEKPTSRVHLHDNVNHVIHIHDRAVTYGHLMSNLGFSLSDRILQTRQEAYVDGQGGKLRFILNGRPVINISNRTIESLDVFLIDFSSDDPATLEKRYDAIPRGAAEANLKQDPQACQGGGEAISLWQQLKQALGF